MKLLFIPSLFVGSLSATPEHTHAHRRRRALERFSASCWRRRPSCGGATELERRYGAGAAAGAVAAAWSQVSVTSTRTSLPSVTITFLDSRWYVPLALGVTTDVP